MSSMRWKGSERWVLWLLLTLGLCGPGVGAECLPEADTCEFWLTVDYRLTMMLDDAVLFPHQGNVYSYDVTNISAADPAPLDQVITGDGWEQPRLVIAVNGSMPGPALHVYSTQWITVHVQNNLPSESITMHWHGISQHNTPWMDGVAFVTQCPILPGNSFTYRFKAWPEGTYWYHTHIGSQRSMGLNGALIVHPREPEPDIAGDFVAMVQDYNHDWDSNSAHLRMLHGAFFNRTEVPKTKALDHTFYTLFLFHAGLFNGRGRFYDDTGNHNGAPLETFTVEKGKKYKFRVINNGNQFPFRVSIDDHDLTVVASDSGQLRPVKAESFIVHPGERYDVVVEMDQPVDNYYLRAITLERGRNHTAEAIVRYQGAPLTDPPPRPRRCTKESPCVVVNCPFMRFPSKFNATCLHYDALKTRQREPVPDGPRQDIQEVFLNFVMHGLAGLPGSVNGKVFQNPNVAALLQPTEIANPCSTAECRHNVSCQCTHSLDLKADKVVQLVFLNMGLGQGWTHPIHMHGHRFHVVKVGFPNYDNKTGRFLSNNEDIVCENSTWDTPQPLCHQASWADPSWEGGDVPGMEMEYAPRKDTIVVPAGGYVVVRLRANNPGVWFMHCHIELHASSGMAIMLNESFEQQPTPPPGLLRCGNYPGPQSPAPTPTGSVAPLGRMPVSAPAGSDGAYTAGLFWGVVGTLLAIVVVAIPVILLLVWRRRSGFSETRHFLSLDTRRSGYCTM